MQQVHTNIIVKGHSALQVHISSAAVPVGQDYVIFTTMLVKYICCNLTASYVMYTLLDQVLAEKKMHLMSSQAWVIDFMEPFNAEEV